MVRVKVLLKGLKSFSSLTSGQQDQVLSCTKQRGQVPSMKVVKVSSSSFKLKITEPGGPIPVTRVSDVLNGGRLYLIIN